MLVIHYSCFVGTRALSVVAKSTGAQLQILIHHINSGVVFTIKESQTVAYQVVFVEFLSLLRHSIKP